MNAVCIRIKGDAKSEAGYAHLLETGRKFGWKGVTAADAITPADVDGSMKARGLRWAYPWDKPRRCPFSGLKLTPYRTRDPLARMACFLSHFYLWELAADRGVSLAIFEDDAEAISTTEAPPPQSERFGAISLNDPRGATRLASVYHEAVQRSPEAIAEAPWVDPDRLVPQGLPGNSAYLIHHDFARQLVEHCELLGCWPNDALMCKQLFPVLGCSKRYLTRVTGRASSLA